MDRQTRTYDQEWTTIFVHGPHCSFINVSRATFQSKQKEPALAGRMWPVGRMLPPPDLRTRKKQCTARKMHFFMTISPNFFYLFSDSLS